MNQLGDYETKALNPGCLTDCLNQTEKEFFERERVSRSYKKGQYIYREGFSASDFVIIQSGVVKITKQKNGGEECLLDFKKQNDLIGLESMLENSRYENSAIAFTNVDLWIIKRDTILKLMAQNPEIYTYISTAFVKTISCLLRRIKDLSSGMATAKLGRTLLLLYDYLPEFKDKGISIKRDELGEISGISRETVSRVLSSFKEKKIIDIVDRRIHLLDEKRILKFVEHN